METQETGAELTPEQKIEQKIFGVPEPDDVQQASPEDEAFEAVEEDIDEAVDEVETADDEIEPVDEPVDDIELHDVEIDGQVYEVPAPIRDALMRDSDYTQKTQALSEDRKALDIVRDDLSQQQQQYQFLESIEDETQRSQSIDWQIGELRNYMRANIDGLTGNQLEKVRFQIDELTVEKDGIVQALRTKYGEFQQAAEQARQELRDKSTEALKSRLPNWGDEAEQQSRAYGVEMGFSEQEIDAALDPRERQVLWEASEYRRLKAGAGKAVRKARSAPKITTKGRQTVSNETRRKISIRKRLNNETDPKRKAKIIQEDMERRLNL